LEEEQGGFGSLFVLRKVGADAALLLAAEGGIGQDDVHTIAVADFFQWKAQAVERIDPGRF